MSGRADNATVRVAIRFRPLSERESINQPRRVKRTLISTLTSPNTDGQTHAWAFTDTKKRGQPRSVYQCGKEKIQGQTSFSFEEIFLSAATTSEVYEATCAPVVHSVLNGVDGAIFSYGQTASGKTYTMQGADSTDRSSQPKGDISNSLDNEGVIQMASRALFDYVKLHPKREFLIRLGYVEIYNEHVRDLLDDQSASDVVIREDKKSRGGVHIGTKEVLVCDHASLIDTLVLGNKNRSVGQTAMNEMSSRSHAIFRITIESREISDESDNEDEQSSDNRAVLVATLNLVDLAGSESVKSTNATGKRQKEGGKINLSLLALSNVIHSLSQPANKRPKYINYRDSKLTRILQPSLKGEARTAILCCASQSLASLEETRSTLKFASRAKLVQVHAKKNEIMDDRAMIRRLQKELAAAKKALKEAEERERQQIKATDNAELSAASMRQSINKIESIIMSPKHRSPTKGLAASLDPALSRMDKTNDMHARGRHSIVDYMPVGFEMLHVIEEDDVDGSTCSSRHTTETDILKEALKKKNEKNNELEDQNKELEDQLQRLKEELALREQESMALKAERDAFAASNTHATRNGDIYDNDDELDCLLPARRTFWEIIFGRKQGLLECCKFA